MKIKIQLSNQCFRRKPDKSEAASISREFTGEETEITIDEFANKVGNEGRSFVPAILKPNRRRENFKYQKMFVLDFDGGITPEEFMDRAKKYDLCPAVLYETFSSTVAKRKFRAVFINDLYVEEIRIAELILQMLCVLFPEADQQCKDVSRMFYGGKGILYRDSTNVTNIYDVALAMQAYLREKDFKNYGRCIKETAHKLGVVCDEQLLLGIYRDDGEEKRIFPSILYIIQGNIQNSSISYAVQFEDTSSPDTPNLCAPKKNIPIIQKKSVQDIARQCRLFRDFYEKDIPHGLKFMLATNLRYVKGGKKLFLEGLEENQEKWKIHWKYIMERDYKPMGCKKGGCPYAKECGSSTLVENLKHKIHRLGKYEEYIPIKEAEERLLEAMVNALKGGEGIHLIKAQTALGKTWTYCRIAKELMLPNPLMIVAPTNKLQLEIRDNLEKNDVQVFATPNLEDVLHKTGLENYIPDIKELYDTGYGYKAKKRLEQIVREESDHLSKSQKKQIKEYLQFKKRLNGTCCVVTTHAMFLDLGEEILSRYEVVVDEDILMTLFKEIAMVSFEDLKKLCQNDAVPIHVKRMLDSLLSGEDGECRKMECLELKMEELDAVYETGIPIQASFPNLVCSASYYVDKKNRQVYYFKAKPLPQVKMTVVSATLNGDLYREYTGGNRKIYKKEIPRAKYKGRLYQYASYSMSRSFIDSIGFQNVENTVRSMIKKERVPMITFKKYSGENSIYFGKTEGFNEYKGKDLIVLGTPHGLPVVYKLIGCYLNSQGRGGLSGYPGAYDITDDMNVRYVLHNGWSFSIMTFGNEKMRELQFYFIETELEQAVGRARLLRCECSVYLFSNFPCVGATVIQDKYLNGCRKQTGTAGQEIKECAACCG